MNEALKTALEAGDARQIQHLLEAQPNLTEQLSSEHVLNALYFGRGELARVLVEAGVKLNVFAAAAAGEFTRVKALVSSGGDVNAFAPDGFTALQLAAFFGHERVGAYLLEHGADVNAVSKGVLRTTPLLAALASPNPAFALRLLEAGADVHARGDAGLTSLHSAAQGGHIEIVEALLEHGADAKVVTDAGKTPRDVALEAGQLGAARAL